MCTRASLLRFLILNTPLLKALTFDLAESDLDLVSPDLIDITAGSAALHAIRPLFFKFFSLGLPRVISLQFWVFFVKFCH